MSSVLANLQAAAARELSRLRDLRGIPIVVRRNGDLSARIGEAVKLGKGLCIVVMPPQPTAADADPAHLVLTEVIMVIRVVENAFAAHPRHTALSVAERVTRALQGWYPPVDGITTPLSLEADDGWDMPDEPDKKGRYTIEINMATSAAL